MVTVDKAVVARLKSHGLNFEILVDCENAIKIKYGQALEWRDVLAVEKIFSDASKGIIVPEVQLRQVFNTLDPKEVALQIIKKGEIQLTAEYRERFREEKRRRIINEIHRNAVDPKTGIPHPLSRIEDAIREAKVKIDEFKPVETQIEEIIKKLRP
ncbi:MAG: ribosome assembly factor SBDS, partial [Candidatus Woesearchaeota archaeon]